MWYVIWTVLVIAALVTPVVLAVHLWRKLIALAGTTSQSFESLERTVEEFEAVKAVSKPYQPGPIATESGLLAASGKRDEILRTRQANRERRLNRAIVRWRNLGLIAPRKK